VNVTTTDAARAIARNLNEAFMLSLQVKHRKRSIDPVFLEGA